MVDFEFTITESDSLVDLEEYIDYLIMERCNEIYYKIISQNTEYRNLQAQIKDCFQELLKYCRSRSTKKLRLTRARELTGYDRNIRNVTSEDYLQADIERWIRGKGMGRKMNIRSGKPGKSYVLNCWIM